MGVKVREKPPKSSRWYVFIDYKGRRKAKYVGQGPGGQRAAKVVAKKIQAKLWLAEGAQDWRAETGALLTSKVAESRPGVYFVMTPYRPDVIRIGRSDDVAGRVRTQNSLHPVDLIVVDVHYTMDPAALEHALFVVLEPKRVRRHKDWFYLSVREIPAAIARAMALVQQDADLAMQAMKKEPSEDSL